MGKLPQAVQVVCVTLLPKDTVVQPSEHLLVESQVGSVTGPGQGTVKQPNLLHVVWVQVAVAVQEG
jgi:hypothetical protein